MRRHFISKQKRSGAAASLLAAVILAGTFSLTACQKAESTATESSLNTSYAVSSQASDLSETESSLSAESSSESSQESSGQESSRQESSKQESSKQESSKQESSKQESSKQESSQQESSQPASQPVAPPVPEPSVEPVDIYFGENVTVATVNVQGMTMEQATAAVQYQIEQLREPVSISVTCDNQTITLTENDFHYSSDINEVLLEAYHYSRHETNTITFPVTRNRGVTNFSVTSELDTENIGDALKKVTDVFDTPAVNAHVASFDPNATEKFTYADGHNGYEIDRNELKKNVLSILNQRIRIGSFSLECKKTTFSVTIDEVKANTKLIASHYTTAANVYNSNYNMELALRAASGTILQPGETFSFNNMTGNTTNGNTHYYPNGTVGAYLPSTAIGGGGYITAYGGGICQASTTLYICAMKAGMTAVERYAHAYPSSYCSKGLDATINYGSLDMKFRNDLKMPVYIATYVYDYNKDGLDELLVEMYGPVSAEYDEIVPVGWVDSASYYGFSAKAAQVYFKNGKEIRRVLLPSGGYDYRYDTYDSVLKEMPSDTQNGPAVAPTKQPPAIYSPNGCGSSAPIPYGTAESYLQAVQDQKNKKT